MSWERYGTYLLPFSVRDAGRSKADEHKVKAREKMKWGLDELKERERDGGDGRMAESSVVLCC